MEVLVSDNKYVRGNDILIRQVKSRRMRWARMGEERKVYKVLVGKPEGRRPLGRSRCRWEDDVRKDLREIGLGGCGLDSTGSGQGPVAGCCECGDEPSGSCATELVSYYISLCFHFLICIFLSFPPFAGTRHSAYRA
jgi:hypothetical protein